MPSLEQIAAQYSLSRFPQHLMLGLNMSKALKTE